MSGYADYKNPDLYDGEKYVRVVVDQIQATPANFAEYGHFVYDYEAEPVIIVPWPVTGDRPLVPGTGIGGGITEGIFDYWYDAEYLHAINNAVGGDYIIGKTEISPADGEQYILTREANYHPDGGQVFYPADSRGQIGFMLLLALPGDDICPQKFKVFRFDGSCGVQINPGVWHQPLYFIKNKISGERARFITKQGKVHGCVAVDFLTEFKSWVAIKL